MNFSVPQNALIVIVDGEHAVYYRNIANTGIKIEKDDDLSSKLSHEHDRGAARVPHETSPNEQKEASFASRVANDLYERVHKGGIDALILIADPQTLGQIRPNLHQEVTKRITGELHKTLVKSSIQDIEKILTTAAA